VDSEKWKYVDKNGFAESRADQTGWSQVFAPPRSDGPGNFNKHEQNGGRLFSVSKLILEATLYPEAAMDWAEQVRGSTAIAVALMHGAATRNCSALPYPTLVRTPMATASLAHGYCEVAYGCTRNPSACMKDCFGKTACDYYGDMTWGLRDGQLGPILELLKALLGLRVAPNGTMHLYHQAVHIKKCSASPCTLHITIPKELRARWPADILRIDLGGLNVGRHLNVSVSAAVTYSAQAIDLQYTIRSDQMPPIKSDDDAASLAAPPHLRFMGYSDRYAADPTLPAPPVTSDHANLYTHRELDKIIARFRDDGLPGMMMLMESEWWKGMRDGNGHSASALLPGWEVHVDAFAKAVSNAPSGSVVGVQLGDELVCLGLPLSNLSAIAARLRPRLPRAIFMYTNECFVHARWPSHACDAAKHGRDCAVKNKKTQVPGVHNECRNGFCADRVWAFIPSELDFISLDTYCRDDKYCNVSADIIGEATAAVAEAEHYLMPLLQPHQRLWAVPGLFGPASARSATARAAYDALLVRKLEGWLDVIRGDKRWVGLLGWKWPSMNTIAPQYALGAAAFPKLLAMLAQNKPPPLPPLDRPSTANITSTVPINFTAVFTAGEEDETGFAINSFRIPGFVVANTTLIAAAEARLYSYEDLSPHHLVIKRSSDMGRTWGPLQTVVAPHMFKGGTAGMHGDVYYDPTPVFDARKATIHLIFAYQQSIYINWTSCTRGDNATGPSTLGNFLGCREKDPANPLGQQLFSVSSSDFGDTWGKPRNLSFAYTASARGWCGVSGGGGGNGIQLSHSGRLIVPGYHGGCHCRGGPGVLGSSCLQSHVLLADSYSSDGPNWRLSEQFGPGSAEGSVAELPRSAANGGGLIFVARLERNVTHCVPSATHCAGVMFSTNSGTSWHGELDEGQLLDPRWCSVRCGRFGGIFDWDLPTT
jgi:hypothetical protein